jgi:2-dehydropantoate 2-reductase
MGGRQLNEGKTSWPRTAVVGAGAVGCYFGGMLARAGAPVVLIGRAGLADAVRENGLFLDTLAFQERVNVESSTEMSAAQSAELVLFCVKTLDTETAAQQLARYLRAGAKVVSLQNGVNNGERIRAAAGIEVLPAAVYVAAAMAGPGRVKHSGRGDLVMGPRSQRTEQVAAVFEHAGVGCRISDNIAGELWTKLVWNCAGNAISALARVNYGQIAASQEARPLLEAVVYETLAVARAHGVRMAMLDNPQAAIDGALVLLAKQMGPATSSTAQDLARGKRTEIDALNGYVARLGTKLGVATPVNYTLFSLVKLAEMNLTPSTS